MASKSHAKGLYDVLHTLNLDSDCTLLVGGLTPEPDAQVAIMHSGGLAGEVAVAIDYPSIQMISRGGRTLTGYDDAWKKLNAIREALIGITHPTDFPELDSCTARSDILDLGKDDQQRPMFSLNLRLIVSYTSSGYREALEP